MHESQPVCLCRTEEALLSRPIPLQRPRGRVRRRAPLGRGLPRNAAQKRKRRQQNIGRPSSVVLRPSFRLGWRFKTARPSERSAPARSDAPPIRSDSGAPIRSSDTHGARFSPSPQSRTGCSRIESAPGSASHFSFLYFLLFRRVPAKVYQFATYAQTHSF